MSSLTLDTFAVMARSIADIQQVGKVLGLRDDEPPRQIPLNEATFAFVKSPIWPSAGSGTVAALQRAAKILIKAGAHVVEVTLPHEFDDIISLQNEILEAEIGVAFHREYSTSRDQISDYLASIAQTAHTGSKKAYVRALDKIAALRPKMDEIADRYTAIVTPSAIDVAPKGTGTGSSDFNAIWTALHMPVINVPGFKGKLPALNLTPPLVPNPSGIGRIHDVGPDAVRLKKGDLVFIDGLIRARDDANVALMPGHMTGGHPNTSFPVPIPRPQKLMRGVWRDGSWQRYQKVPLEVCFLLDEKRLFGDLGYNAAVLHTIAHYAVAAGALLEAARVKTAEVVVVGPSGGSFGGSAVEIALAVGAEVIALGRSEGKLAAMREKLANPRLKTVVMTGDDQVDAAAILRATPNSKGADVFNDWTPGELATPPYLSAAVLAMKQSGRIVLSGGAGDKCRLPYGLLILKNIQLIGKWMYEHQTLVQVINMITQEQLRIGQESGTEITTFGLDGHEDAVEHARKHGGWRSYTVIEPDRD
ncbi:Glutamyl-tRNA(Gln) amidotransferase subunit A [Colletotrichum sp. SAR 10_98]|nr:Glutamyl-tRNA(Gln) amidotransferase subunit A [Colletotrichum sp. SAR 10_98]